MEVCSQNLKDPFTVLLKVNGNKCNMACEYCSELPKHFSDEQCTFSYDKFKSLLVKLPKEVDLIFHGGEPTLIGRENILKLAKLIQDLGFTYKPTVQTNGLLDNQWVDFFKEHADLMRVSVSIDGDGASNSYRKTTGGISEMAFTTTDRFIRSLDKNDVEFRCIATINQRSWRRGKEIVQYFSSFNHLKYLRINPCFDIDEKGIRPWAVSPKEYKECLSTIFVEMIKSGCYKRIKIDPIMDIIDELENDGDVYQFKCNKFASLFPDGQITSCDAMREIVQNVCVDEKMFHNFTYPSYAGRIIKMCNSCPSISICKGGCPALLERYEKCDSKYVKEYCEYRVGIRDFIKSYVWGKIS